MGGESGNRVEAHAFTGEEPMARDRGFSPGGFIKSTREDREKKSPALKRSYFWETANSTA